MTENNYRLFKAIFLCILGLTIGMLQQRTDALLRELKADSATVAQSWKDASTSLQTIATASQGVLTDTNRTEELMAGFINSARHGMVTPEQTKELVDRAANLMDNANESVIRLGDAANSFKGIPPTVQGAIQQLAADSHNTLQGSQALMAAATSDLDDPAIKDTLKHVDQTASNADATTADVKKIADEWAAPIKGTWNHVKAFLFEAAGPLASIATAIK